MPDSKLRVFLSAVGLGDDQDVPLNHSTVPNMHQNSAQIPSVSIKNDIDPKKGKFEF